jgi:MarR family transcriptional regulator, organic hydroperoxide resistance regulator
LKEHTLNLDNQLCFALYAATHAVTRAYRARLAGLGLTFPQYLTLMALWEKDGLTVRGLATRLKIDSATLTPLLKRLEASGFVSRRRNLEDERLVQVFLTERGLSVRSEAEEIRTQVVSATALGTPEYEALRDKLHALVGSMGGD